MAMQQRAEVKTESEAAAAAKASPEEHYPAAGRWDVDPAPAPRIKLMCSHGGRILPRPHDSQLRYVGGETRIVVVSRHVPYPELMAKLARMFGAGVIVKYQLPSEDLDALVSVTSDEDLENMMEECDRLQACTRSPSRLRLFLFPRTPDCRTSFSDLLDGNINREHWFVDVLNGVSSSLPRLRSETSSVVSELPDYLSGLDSMEDWSTSSNSRQHAGEKRNGSAPSGLLLHGWGDPASSPASPMNRSAITTMSSPPSSAPSSISSMPSAVVDAALHIHSQVIPQLEEPPPILLAQQRSLQNGPAASRPQQVHLGDAGICKISEPSLVPAIPRAAQPDQAGELPAMAVPPKLKLQQSPDKHLQAANIPSASDQFETREESLSYSRVAFKPADEVKQELEIHKAEVVILSGSEQGAKKAGEERPRERAGNPTKMVGDQSFVESSEPEISNAKEMQGQDRAYAEMADLRIGVDASALTYATQSPAVQLQNFRHAPAVVKNQVPPARLLPSQPPQMYPRTIPVQQQPNAIAINPEALPPRDANPAILPHYQRQPNDPLHQIPYHPSAHASPSRFRGPAPAGYQNPSDMKRVIVTAAGLPLQQQSRPPLNPQYTEQMPYTAISNAAYAACNKFAAPSNYPNPSLHDTPRSSEGPSQRLYQEIYVDPMQDPQGIIDGRQGRKYMMRN